MPPRALAPLLVLLLALLAPAATADAPDEPSEPAIRVFVAHKIHTMNPRQPEAQAVSVKEGRILRVGSLEHVLRGLREEERLVDWTYEDKILMPGFVDNHLHPSLGAILLPGEFAAPFEWRLPQGTAPGVLGEEAFASRLRDLHFRGSARWRTLFVRPIRELLDRIAGSFSRGEDDDDLEWLVVWGHHPFFHGEITREKLDGIALRRPIVVWHRSFHELVVNSAALEAMGLDAAAVSRHPGVDLAAGRFTEHGMQVALPALAPVVLAPERYRLGLERTRELIHRGGITTIADMAVPLFDFEAEWPAVEAVLGAEETPFRTLLVANAFALRQRLGDDGAQEFAAALRERATEKLLVPKAVKLFADGAFFSLLMQMREPYTDGHEGRWLMAPDELLEAARRYWRAGYQLHVHVNGDLGLEKTLDALEQLARERRRRDHRTTLHHVGFAAPGQAERVAKLGALVSANPYYLWALSDVYAQAGLGPERAERISPLGSLVGAGVRVSLHSDLTMAPARPLRLAAIAVNRISAFEQEKAPSERLSVEQALRAITIEAAYALRMEGEIGSIEPRKRADFTVLGGDPFELPPAEWDGIRIWATVLEGTPRPVARH